MGKVNTTNELTDVIFQDQATSVGAGTIFAVGGYKNLTIEIFGTSTSRTITFLGTSKSGIARNMQGCRIPDFTMASSTTSTGEIWQFDITGLNSVTMNLTAVAGGDVSVAGRAIA